MADYRKSGSVVMEICDLRMKWVLETNPRLFSKYKNDYFIGPLHKRLGELDPRLILEETNLFK